jgi:hypothetical protein
MIYGGYFIYVKYSLFLCAGFRGDIAMMILCEEISEKQDEKIF